MSENGTYQSYYDRGITCICSLRDIPDTEYDVEKADAICDEAIKNFSTAIEIKPECAEAYRARGDAYYQKMEFAPGIADCTKAIKIDPTNPELYFLRAQNYRGSAGELSLGNQKALAPLDRAVGDLKKAIALKSDYTEAYRILGHVYEGYFLHYEHNNSHKKAQLALDRAILYYTQAILLNPDDAISARSNRNIVLQQYWHYYYERDQQDSHQAMAEAVEREENYHNQRRREFNSVEEETD